MSDSEQILISRFGMTREGLTTTEVVETTDPHQQPNNLAVMIFRCMRITHTQMADGSIESIVVSNEAISPIYLVDAVVYDRIDAASAANEKIFDFLLENPKAERVIELANGKIVEYEDDYEFLDSSQMQPALILPDQDNLLTRMQQEYQRRKSRPRCSFKGGFWR